MSTDDVRIHHPQATPARWVDELNNRLEDAQLSDTSVVLTTNPLRRGPTIS
jgi:hypothetical protein